jgi:hypothetical protein
MKRKLVALLALAAGMFTGLQIMRRLSGGQQARVDLYYEDGSRVSLSDAEAAPLLETARTALRASHA